MKNTTYTILLTIILTFIIFVSGCSGHPNISVPITKPPVDYVKVTVEDGNGIVVLIMRTWDTALSEDEIIEIKNNLNKELPIAWNGVVETTSIPPNPNDPEMRILTFCYAAYTDKAPDEFSINSFKSNEGYGSVYSSAENWFVEELAGVRHSYK
jgi:hypothetical protein